MIKFYNKLALMVILYKAYKHPYPVFKLHLYQFYCVNLNVLIIYLTMNGGQMYSRVYETINIKLIVSLNDLLFIQLYTDFLNIDIFKYLNYIRSTGKVHNASL